MEDMNMTEMVNEQAVEITAAETANGGKVKALLTVGAIAGVGYLAGKIIERGVRKVKTLLSNRKDKAVAVDEQSTETVEAEIVD